MCENSTYVLVMYDFEYEDSDGKKITMKEGEEFLLLNKTNSDWWQVIRDGERRPFYAPASYVEEITLEQRKPKPKPKKKQHELSSRSISSKVKSQSASSIIESHIYENEATIKKSKSCEKIHTDAKTSPGLMFSNPLYNVRESERDAYLKFKKPEISYAEDREREEKFHSVFLEDSVQGDDNLIPKLPVSEIQQVFVTKRKVSVEEEKNQRRSVSPIYANLPLNSYDCPPSPKEHNIPIKILLNHWVEYEDSNGRKYYYNRLTKEKSWKPPRRRSEQIEKDNKTNINKKIPPTERIASYVGSNSSLQIKTPPLLRPASLAERGLKTRSMILTNTRSSTLPRNSSGQQLLNLYAGHLKITRQGILNKTKLIEDGKRLRKNWSASFIVLSDIFLLFYKDMKTAEMGSPTNKPEICIDLAGALIEWAADKSSRKNVFQISTVLGLQILIQDDNNQTSKEWFDAIKNAIAKLPSGLILNTTEKSMNNYEATSSLSEEVKKPPKMTRKMKYSSSQEDLDSSPTERKFRIRDKLINFFLRRPSIDFLRERGIVKEELVFGCNLHSLCSREKTTVPKFVQKCISLIEEKDMKADGLYRASGNLSQVQKIRFQVNQDDVSCLEIEDDVHVLTGALKMFFRELKEPLIPFNTFEKFLSSIMNPDKSCRLQTFSELVLSLPRPNYDTLKFLLLHLLRVTEHSEQNRMHIQNLAIVFGPTLMWPEMESANLALDMMHQNQIIELLLMEFSSFFR